MHPHIVSFTIVISLLCQELILVLLIFLPHKLILIIHLCIFPRHYRLNLFLRVIVSQLFRMCIYTRNLELASLVILGDLVVLSLLEQPQVFIQSHNFILDDLVRLTQPWNCLRRLIFGFRIGVRIEGKTARMKMPMFFAARLLSPLRVVCTSIQHTHCL